MYSNAWTLVDLQFGGLLPDSENKDDTHHTQHPAPVPKTRDGFDSVVCIGDLHGQLHKVERLWINLEQRLGQQRLEESAVVFLGDYCDRGPDTKGSDPNSSPAFLSDCLIFNPARLVQHSV